MNRFALSIALTASMLATPALAGSAVRLQGTDVAIGYDIMDSAGLYWDENMQRGNYVAVAGLMPDTPESWAEWDPLAIATPVIGVATDGTIYQGKAFNAGYINCSPAPVLFVVLEGLTTQRSDVRVVFLSRRATSAYRLDGGNTTGFDPKKFKKDPAWRQEFILSQGTPLSVAQPATNIMRDLFPRWDSYSVKGQGSLLKTPYDPDQVKYLSGINPQYKFGEKFVGTASVSISPDIISTAIGALFDLLGAATAKPKGFDTRSTIGREQYGYNVQVAIQMRDLRVQSCIRSIAQAGTP